jgi:isoleucyl-tRNA synthetase
VSVEVDVELDDELEREGRALDLIRLLNGLRKDAGLALTDRIVVTLPSAESDLLPEFGSRIRDEVLAVRIETDAVESPSLVKA